MSTRSEVSVVDPQGKDLGRVSVDVVRAKPSEGVAILAHGAGGNMDTPSLRELQSRLASAGVTAVRFNFLYSENKRKSPDPQPKLVACWRSVADWARAELAPKNLFLGGRSMGGRMASYLVADGYPCEGIVFLAYPLHPPGRRDKQRRDHLPQIRVPMLFVSGTRDAFAELDLLAPLLEELGADSHLIEGADHGFKVPKSAGRKPKEIDDEVARTVLAFLRSAGSRGTHRS